MSNAPTPSRTGKRFWDMTGREKLVFIGKAFVFFISGGFAYPTIWVD